MTYQEINVGLWNLRLTTAPGEANLRNAIPGQYSEFIARFKHGRSKLADARHFAKFLVANFTPAEYAMQRAEGIAPLLILNAKGYLSPNQRRAQRFAREEAAEVAALAAARVAVQS